MKEGDLLLQAALGGSLHLLPGKFDFVIFYLRSIPTLLLRRRQHCHCTNPWTPHNFSLSHPLNALF